jgi:hypothetical protein
MYLRRKIKNRKKKYVEMFLLRRTRKQNFHHIRPRSSIMPQGVVSCPKEEYHAPRTSIMLQGVVSCPKE